MSAIHPHDPRHPDFVKSMVDLVSKKFFAYKFAAAGNVQVPSEAKIEIAVSNHDMAARWAYRGKVGPWRRVQFDWTDTQQRSNTDRFKQLGKMVSRMLIRHIQNPAT